MGRSIIPWLPGFKYVDLDLTGIEAPEVGRAYDETSNPKVCWHTTEGSTLKGAERAFAKYPPHVGVCFETRERNQYLPLDKCSFSLRGSESDDEFVIQVEVVGFAGQSHTWSNEKLEWLGRGVLAPISLATGCPTTVVPMGFHGEGEGIRLASSSSPIRFPSESALRAFAGQFGHQHAPFPDEHWDPGKLNANRIKLAADAILHASPPSAVKEIIVQQAINFMVHRKSNGAVLFVMRNLNDSYRPFACFGVDGVSYPGFLTAEVPVCKNLSDGDFAFFERYRIDNIPEKE